LGIDEPKPVRAGEELDAVKLAKFLEVSSVAIEQFPGGHSNLTYLVKAPEREMVLRRPPFGSNVKTAHDMGREVAVLSKLAPVYDKAPRVITYEPSGDVLGAPFFLMERRRGVILRRELPAGTDVETTRRICELLVDALVELHAVD
jgi:aminoglycoside phosphotransferase (APT) family kinase protein